MADFASLRLPTGFGVSLAVRQLAPVQRLVFEQGSQVELSSASAGKLLVLLATADALQAGTLTGQERVSKDELESVEYAGLWHRLQQRSLAVGDLAKLVGTVSDNLATNGLIHVLGGVELVVDVARAYGVHDVHLHDLVRQERGPADPAAFSSGTALGYVDLLTMLWTRTQAGGPVACQVLDWLADSADLSAVGDAFNLDPLWHRAGEGELRLWNKTGSDTGVRSDCGIVIKGEQAYTYALLLNWSREVEQSSGAMPSAARDYARGVGAALAGLLA